MKQRDEVTPLARKEGLVVKELPEEMLVYDLERHKAHCLNPTAAMVWTACDGARGIPELARHVSAKVGSPIDEEFVLLALDQLGKARLMESAGGRRQPSGISRRDLLRKGVIAAAVALPLVTSIVAPTAYAANSCNALLCSSTTNTCDPAPGCHCNGGPGLGTCVAD